MLSEERSGAAPGGAYKKREENGAWPEEETIVEVRESMCMLRGNKSRKQPPSGVFEMVASVK